jgi:hypothetical protein
MPLVSLRASLLIAQQPDQSARFGPRTIHAGTCDLNRERRVTSPDLAADYFVVTRQNRTTGTWVWEIHRRSKPLGVRLHSDGFASPSAAKLAAKKVLKDLLDDLAKDEQTRSPN